LKIPVNSLRTGILAQLTFLILAAMLLINVVMIKLAERDLIRTRFQAGQLLGAAVEQMIGQHLSGPAKKLTDLAGDSRFRAGLLRLLGEGDYAHIVIVNREGEKLLAAGFSEDQEGYALSGARESAATGMGSHHFSGTVWGVIWLNKRDLWISSPLSFEGRLQGGMTLSCSLVPLYETLRNSQKVILLYIFLDTLVLVMVGLVLLSRIVVKPIHQLLRLTAGYKEGDEVPAVAGGSGNEIGSLPDHSTTCSGDWMTTRKNCGTISHPLKKRTRSFNRLRMKSSARRNWPPWADLPPALPMKSEIPSGSSLGTWIC
jgi:hypothetical protein